MLSETEQIAFQAAREVGGVETKSEARRRLDTDDGSRSYTESYCYTISDRFG
jgi:hypothetical protein